MQVRDGQRPPSTFSSRHPRASRVAPQSQQSQQSRGPVDQPHLAGEEKGPRGLYAPREDLLSRNDKAVKIAGGAEGPAGRGGLALSYANHLAEKYTSQYLNISGSPDTRQRATDAHAPSRRSSGVWFQVRRRNGDRKRKMRDKNARFLDVSEGAGRRAQGKRDAGDSRAYETHYGLSRSGPAASSGGRGEGGGGGGASQWQWDGEWRQGKGDPEARYHAPRDALPKTRLQTHQQASARGKLLPLLTPFLPHNPAGKRASRLPGFPTQNLNYTNDPTKISPPKEQPKREELDPIPSLGKHGASHGKHRRSPILQANGGDPAGEWRTIRTKGQTRRDIRSSLQDALRLNGEGEGDGGGRGGGGGCPGYQSTDLGGADGEEGAREEQPGQIAGIPNFDGKDLGFGEDFEFAGGHYIFGPVHVVETLVTVVVKDINDNAPLFPNMTIYGEVQENGPIRKYRADLYLSSSIMSYLYLYLPLSLSQ